MDLPLEMHDILHRNGMHAHLAHDGKGLSLIVQGHDSPMLTYGITERQFGALCDWGNNSANRRCYDTFASIIAADFDMPKDFVHARNAGGRVNMGMYDNGFFYKQQATAQVVDTNILQDMREVLTPLQRERMPEAKSYKELITSDVYFTNEKWQEVLASHGIVIDAAAMNMTIQSQSVPVDMTYDLGDEELAKLTNNSLKEVSVAKRLEIINDVIKSDFKDSVTKEMLDSKQALALELHAAVREEVNADLQQQQGVYSIAKGNGNGNIPEGTVLMDGKSLEEIAPDKGWFREGRFGREVTVDDIKVEPTDVKGQYRMTAVIDGKVVSHEITQKQYDKFMAIDDLHRMKLFSKIFGEVEMKSRDNTPLGTKIGAALMAGLTVAGEFGRGIHEPHGPHHEPSIFIEHHGGERVYSKPGVDSPQDVAARHFDAAMNHELSHELKHGL
jgi:hypothetical protein